MLSELFLVSILDRLVEEKVRNWMCNWNFVNHVDTRPSIHSLPNLWLHNFAIGWYNVGPLLNTDEFDSFTACVAQVLNVASGWGGIIRPCDSPAKTSNGFRLNFVFFLGGGRGVVVVVTKFSCKFNFSSLSLYFVLS
jgi:hypothetical protein